MSYEMGIIRRPLDEPGMAPKVTRIGRFVMNGKRLIVTLALVLLTVPLSARAGMSHQPHSVKKFMGFERRDVVAAQMEKKVVHPHLVRKDIQGKGVKPWPVQ